MGWVGVSALRRSRLRFGSALRVEVLTLQKGFIKELFSWVDSVELCVSLNKWKVYIFRIVKLGDLKVMGGGYLKACN